jgi:hypothetical protein
VAGDLTLSVATGGITSGMIADGTVANIDVASGIGADKISSGVVSNTEFDYLNNVTSNIQTQLDSKAASSALSSYVAKAGDTMSGNLIMNNTIRLNAQNNLEFRDSDSSNFVALRAPASVTTDRTFILPATYGTSGEVLSTDGAGGLNWISVTGGGGDITGVIAGTPTTAGTSISVLIASNTLGVIEQSATFVIAKGTPVVSSWPTAASITYGQALSNSALSGGAANVAGSFAWAAPATLPNAGSNTASVTFTPTDAANYNTVTTNVVVLVNKATPVVSNWPTAAPLYYGQELGSSALSGGAASGHGDKAHKH